MRQKSGVYHWLPTLVEVQEVSVLWIYRVGNGLAGRLGGLGLARGFTGGHGL